MKNRYLFLTAMALLFFVAFKVDAATCSTDELNALKVEANNVKIAIDLVKPSPDDPISVNRYSYNLKMVNIPKDIYFTFDDLKADYVQITNGEVNLEQFFSYGGYNFPINFFANSNTNCADELLRSYNLYVPYYNKYSEREECSDYKNYNICKVDSNTEEITEEDFLKLLEEVKKKEAERQNQPITTPKKKSIIDLYLDNKKITIPVTIGLFLLIGIGCFTIAHKNKTKVKIDLGDKV